MVVWDLEIYYTILIYTYRVSSTNVEIFLTLHGPHVAQVGAGATVKEFSKLVQYSQSNH